MLLGKYWCPYAGDQVNTGSYMHGAATNTVRAHRCLHIPCVTTLQCFSLASSMDSTPIAYPAVEGPRLSSSLDRQDLVNAGLETAWRD
jgi:hypothetical protein